MAFTRLQQGQVQEHVLDAEWHHRGLPERCLHRQLHEPEHRGQQDYSNYMTSHHGSYYNCSGAGAGYAYFRSGKPTTCYPPVGSWRDQVNTHQSHELRVTTSEENRFRATLGAYWEVRHQRRHELQLSDDPAVRSGQSRDFSGRRPGLRGRDRPDSRLLREGSEPAPGHEHGVR